MYIPNTLNRDLERKRAAIVDAKDGRFKLYKQIQTNKEVEALIHTARGEIPLTELHYKPGFKHTERFKKVREGIDQAWNLGIIAYPTEGLNESFLRGLAWELDPEFFRGSDAYFRRPNELILTTVGAWNHNPPNPLKIQDELYRHLFENPELSAMSIPEQAIYFNMHIARIQPFPDCNKRTGKMVQNLHLNSGAYPPATVFEGEVDYYNRLLGEAIGGFKERQGEGRPSKEEKEFFEFMGTRVNINLDSILEMEQNLPSNLNGKSNGKKKKSSSKILVNS